MRLPQRSESFALTESFNFQKPKEGNEIKIERNYDSFQGKESLDFLAVHMFSELLEKKQKLLMYYLLTLLDYIVHNFIPTPYRARSEGNNNEKTIV